MADKSDPLNPTLRASQLSQATVETDHSGVPKLNIVQGLVMAPGITEESLKDIQERFTYRDDDLFIATPPKCGTTWIQQIVKLIRNNGVESGVDSDVAIPWFEQMTVEEIEVHVCVMCDIVWGTQVARNELKFCTGFPIQLIDVTEMMVAYLNSFI